MINTSVNSICVCVHKYRHIFSENIKYLDTFIDYLLDYIYYLLDYV